MCVRKVIRHAHKIPFHCDIGVSSGQKSAEVQIFLDCSKHALRLNGTIDPEQDPFGCGNLFLHQWICKVDICRWVKKIEIAFCERLIYSETENYRRKGTVDI